MADQKIGIQITANDKTKAAFKSVDRNLKAMTSGIMSVKGALVGLLGVGGFTALAARSIDAADAIAKAAERTGFATDSLQELRFAASQTGVGITELEGGLARFTKRLGLARMETGAANDTYKKLGIDLSQTNNQVFRQVVNTLSSMESQTDRLALTTRLFGDDAQRLELTFRNGTRALDEYAEKANRLGLVLGADLLKGAEQANDQLSIMKQILDAQFTRAFVELAPMITAVGQAFADAAPHITTFVSGFMEIEKRSKSATIGTIETLERNADRITEKLARIYAIQADPSIRTVQEIIFGPGDPQELENELLRINGRLFRAREHLTALNNAEPLTINITGGAVDTAGLYGGDGGEDREHDAYLARLQRRYEALNQSLMSERELEILRAEEKRLIFDEMWLNDLLTEEERNVQMQDLERQHQAALTEIANKGLSDRERFERKSMMGKTKFVFNELSSLTQGVAQHNRKMFELNKVAGTANALINTYEGVTKSLSAYPMPWAAAMAAAHLAAGMAQVSAIQSTSFSGGGGGVAPSLSASGASETVATVPTVPNTEQTDRSVVEVHINGDVYDADRLGEVLSDTLTDLIENQDVVLFSSSSRQALELSS